MSSWFITNLIAAFLLPPLSLLLLLAAGIILFRRRPKTARLLLIITFSLLWLCSTPYFADSLLQSLESRSATLNKPYPAADAIVILGAERIFMRPNMADKIPSARAPCCVCVMERGYTAKPPSRFW